MAADELYILKNAPDVKWAMDTFNPICREHNFELDEGYVNNLGSWEDYWNANSHTLRCAEGPHIIELPAGVDELRDYIRKKLKSTQYADAKLVDLDGVLVPVSKKEKIEVSDKEYFVTSQVRNSKRGMQVIIYAGKKGSKQKTQIFVDPQHKKLSFDQNDLNPADVFVKLEATFPDGTKHTIAKEEG